MTESLKPQSVVVAGALSSVVVHVRRRCKVVSGDDVNGRVEGLKARSRRLDRQRHVSGRPNRRQAVRVYTVHTHTPCIHTRGQEKNKTYMLCLSRGSRNFSGRGQQQKRI